MLLIIYVNNGYTFMYPSSLIRCLRGDKQWSTLGDAYSVSASWKILRSYINLNYPIYPSNPGLTGHSIDLDLIVVVVVVVMKSLPPNF